MAINILITFVLAVLTAAILTPITIKIASNTS